MTVIHDSANNGHPFSKKPLWVDIAKAAEARDCQDQHAANAFRGRDAAADSATKAADALADLRKTMADNADVLKSSGTLAHIARFADARAAEPYAVTFGVLLRAVLAVPPQVVLPPIIGGEVALNLLLAVVGGSGAGKGSADKAAAAAVRFSIGGRRIARTLPLEPIGTGEGINRTYARSERDKASGQVALRWHTDTALFGCRDIATLDALISRKGATLLPELLKSYMGEELGFANADPDRRVILPMNSYRLCLSAGVQPENGLVLLNEQCQRDGVPQRFLWAPVRPGVARRRRSADTKAIEPLTAPVPDFGIDPMRFDVGDDDEAGVYDPAAQTLVLIGVGESIAQEIIDADAAKDLDPFGRSADPLAGHRLLARLKVAAALAVLHNKVYVGPEDWQRAERLLAVSAAVAKVVAAESESAANSDAAGRGKLDGRRFAAADEERDAAALRSLMQRITRYLGKQDGWVSRRAIDCSISSKLRRNVEDAISALVGDGTIERRKVQRGSNEVIEYRLAAK